MVAIRWGTAATKGKRRELPADGCRDRARLRVLLLLKHGYEDHLRQIHDKRERQAAARVVKRWQGFALVSSLIGPINDDLRHRKMYGVQIPLGRLVGCPYRRQTTQDQAVSGSCRMGPTPSPRRSGRSCHWDCLGTKIRNRSAKPDPSRPPACPAGARSRAQAFETSGKEDAVGLSAHRGVYRRLPRSGGGIGKVAFPDVESD